VKAFDGVRVLEPWVVYLKPMHENPELSWFETTGRITGDTASVPASHSYLRPALSRFLKAAVPQLLRVRRTQPPATQPTRPASEQRQPEHGSPEP